MNCAACGNELREGAKFCSECGAPSARACANCGHSLTGSDKFCAECGTPVATPATSTPRPVPTATAEPAEERRIVSTLFLDLVGFTPLTQTRDSEEVRSMLTTYFDTAREVVGRFGGVIDKYIGDALMAVWGAHVAHEDDAERMVRAGIELISAIEALGASLGLDGLTARVGGTTGEAAVGGDGNAGTGLIIGDIVNLASRLEGAAPAGRVMVDTTTMELCKGAIEFEPAGQFELKGIAQPVSGHVALRVVAGNQGRRKADGLIPPFVGRTEEVRLLKDSYHATARDRRARMVSIIGQGGIGKSRLAAELWNYLDGLPHTTYWHQGRSPAYGTGISYWSIGEMVRQRCGIAETDDQHRTQTRLRTTLAEYIEDAGDRAWAEPRLEALLGIGEIASADRAELFAAWRMLFTRVAARDTTVMVFEDLHWADDGVLDFIEELVAYAGDSPILVVCLARPELLQRREGWGSRSHMTTSHLGRLADDSIAEMVRGVVPAAPDATVAAIVDQVDGIPLYAVEILRMLASQGLISEQSPGRYAPTGPIDEIEIPDSLQSLVGARLDQLSADERALLNHAAVLGQSFTSTALAALRQESQEMIVAQLEPLVRREILTVNRDPRSPERGQYAFVQSIIREIAHQRITRGERATLHVEAARHFEAIGEPEVAGVVASHYLDAYEAASQRLQDEIRPQTVDALLRAADRAAGLQAHGQVIEVCERGLAIVDDPAAQGALLIRAARSALAGLDDRADQFITDAEAAFAAAGDPHGQLQAAREHARLLNNTYRANEAVAVLEAALPDELEPTSLGASFMSEMARSLMLDGRPGEALPWADRALAIVEDLDDLETFADLLVTKGTALGGQMRLREATVLVEAAIELAESNQYTHTYRRGIQNLGFLTMADTLNDKRLDEATYAQAVRVGEPRYLAEATLSLAWDYLWDLDFERAGELMQTLDRSELSEDVQHNYDAHGWFRRALVEVPHGMDEFFAARHAKLVDPDHQMELNIKGDLLASSFLLDRYDDTIRHAFSFDYYAPLRLDLYWGSLAAIHASDRHALSRFLELSTGNEYRGRHHTAMHRLIQGGVAALAGDQAASAIAFQEVWDLAHDIYPANIQVSLFAPIAALLGWDHPLGYEAGRRAYDLLASVNSQHIAGRYAAGAIPPDAPAISSTAG